MIINVNLVKILQLLEKNGPTCVNDISTAFNTSQPLISQRLKVLKDFKLVKMIKRDKNTLYYDINPKYKESAAYHLVRAYEDLIF